MVLTKLKSFGKQCLRVWSLLRKPKADEFKKVSLVAAVGLLVIGLLGFATALLMSFIFPK